ncbi:serine/threonine protein phosphatase 2A 59 kDa regulatory subunit B' eta isoform-like [Impatiens glandulifera]|uniref:serine/threonine protein phosphatase 2A 59 kDa regulatory subunit B' eta isoform-like n=1 Tax=Impatiens glandulifera TaxID=253017 RepID=UPI001FB0F3FB|nr:serine/threonine protein phosphatase 2A 59 kDa regulatory subunit B' eta isoform-like [Impatiens glandulifera]
MGAQRKANITSPKKPHFSLKDFFRSKDSPFNTNVNKSTLASSSSSSNSPSLEPQEHEDLLSIISYCTFVFNFTDPRESPTQQHHKRLKLLNLLSYLKTPKNKNYLILVEPYFLHNLFTMLSSNLFRPLPPPFNTTTLINFLPDEDLTATPTLDWPHLHLVYEILLTVVSNQTNTDVLTEYITPCFLFNLRIIFQSEDPRERDILKNIVHKIYAIFPTQRSFIRKTTKDVFLRYVYESDRHSGIGEMLEIWGSIINGFVIPLKEEHKVFLTRVLIPLHKPKGMQAYYRQLTYCMSKFVMKEPKLAELAVKGILRHWSTTNCPKEVLLIGEIEALVEILKPEEYTKVAVPLCTQIIKCLNNLNTHVAERALYLWNNEQFWKMVWEQVEEVFPMIVEAVERNLDRHWSSSVRQLTQNVKIMLEETEPELYSKCLFTMEFRELAAVDRETRRREKWERIEIVAARNLGASN